MQKVTIYKPGFLGSAEETYTDVEGIEVNDGVLSFSLEDSIPGITRKYTTNLPFLVSGVYGV
jgi:hypothetical protein